MNISVLCFLVGWGGLVTTVVLVGWGGLVTTVLFPHLPCYIHSAIMLPKSLTTSFQVLEFNFTLDVYSTVSFAFNLILRVNIQLLIIYFKLFYNIF